MFFVVVQLLSHVWLSATPWTVARQDSLSLTISWSLPKFMYIESVMPFNHLILCFPLLFCPHSFPALRLFPMSQLFASGDPNIGASASASVLPTSIQCWFPLRLTGLISLLSKGLSSIFSASLVAQTIKNLPAMRETPVWSLGREDPLEKGMATHSSIPAWRIAWTEELGQATVHGVEKSRTWLSN